MAVKAGNVMRWQYRIKLKPSWQACKKDEISVEELAHRVASEVFRLLAKHPELSGRNIENIAICFAAFVGHDVNAFDYHMNRLYDWADQHAVWVETVL